MWVEMSAANDKRYLKEIGEEESWLHEIYARERESEQRLQAVQLDPGLRGADGE